MTDPTDLTNMTEPTNPTPPTEPTEPRLPRPSVILPWPSAGGSYSADPVTGELTRLTGPIDTPSNTPEE